MKPTRARLLAKLSLALAATVAVALPLVAATDASAQPVVSAEDRCRADLAVSSRRYMESVLFARLRCQSRIILGAIPPSTDCIHGRGDEKLDKRLRKAEDKLTNIGAACSGVNLQLLGFPGVCTDTTGAPFDTNDYAKCTLTKTDEILSQLFNYYYPPLSDFFRGSKATCLKGSPLDAATSFRRIIRAMETCLLNQEVGIVAPNVDCRAEIAPYGPGTGDAKVDTSLSHAYISLLGAIPVACVDFQMNDLNYQSSCPDPTGGLFTIFDLKQCFFGVNRVQGLDFLLITFPTDPVCGNGVVESGEECDLGIAGNSNTKPNTCRNDCKNPVCHDGVTDNAPPYNEQCDDGNTVDGDCCSGECVLDVCGDGVKNCTEQCDTGANNSNTVKDACRLNCIPAHCGDHVTDTNEECDDGNNVDNDGCSSLCIVEYCGDDQVQAPREQCDNGVDNSDTTPDACREDCKFAHCGDGVTDSGEECDDGNNVNNDSCNNSCKIPAVCNNGKVETGEECDTDGSVCPAGEGCSSSCTCEPACPGVGQLVLYAGVGGECSTNSDCPVGTCDDGRCHTKTHLDTGWTGLAHNADINDGIVTRGFLDCPGHGPVCGECNVVGVDPSLRECRCSNNTRTICGDPFKTDSTDCPTCVGGNSKNSRSCGTNGDCLDAGACTNNAKVCSNNNATICTSNGDCVSPGTCTATRLSCSNAKTTFCAANADCSFQGSCTGTATCDCYFGAPFPLSSGGTPACVVNRFAQNITGTANVDQGAGQIAANLKTRVYLGISTTNPCPTCGGTCSNNAAQTCNRNQDCNGGTCNLDPVADDGVRGGVCINGGNAGQACDMTGVNTSFPAYPNAVGGGGYSLDCMPDAGKNLSGTGLVINLTQTTGTATLAAKVSCGYNNPSLLCPCLQCSADPSFPCNSNADCAVQQGACSLASTVRCNGNSDCATADVGPCVTISNAKKCSGLQSKSCANGQGNADNTLCQNVNVGTCTPSTCTSKGNGEPPAPNQCDDGVCVDQGGGFGLCSTGPDSTYCESVVKADGTGILPCNQDDDCTPSAVGIDAGPCTLSERRPCFLDPITATGQPDPETPTGVAAFCVPPTGNSGINGVAGLPGPGRIINQSTAKTFCESNPAKQYIPGAGGCLQP